ncbi:hypothetical protein GCM10029964_026120 [Kibdelosporangium lantanae]
MDVGDATAGAVSGSTLFLRDGLRLLSLDVNPKSPTYLKIIHVKWLSWFADVDDFDFGSDALLYGVTSGGTVITVDPLKGTVRTVARPKVLPYGTYGAVLMSPGRILYAVNNRVGSTSRLYRIPLNAPDTATEIASSRRRTPPTPPAACRHRSWSNRPARTHPRRPHRRRPGAHRLRFRPGVRRQRENRPRPAHPHPSNRPHRWSSHQFRPHRRRPATHLHHPSVKRPLQRPGHRTRRRSGGGR